MAEIHNFQGKPEPHSVGGGPTDAGVEARLRSLENGQSKLEAILAEIKGELKALPKASDIGEIKGRVANLPTTWQLVALLLTTWAAGAAIVFTVMKYGVK